jgi:hypothetical protein
VALAAEAQSRHAGGLEFGETGDKGKMSSRHQVNASRSDCQLSPILRRMLASADDCLSLVALGSSPRSSSGTIRFKSSAVIMAERRDVSEGGERGTVGCATAGPAIMRITSAMKVLMRRPFRSSREPSRARSITGSTRHAGGPKGLMHRGGTSLRD